MIPALLTALLFSFSAIFGHRAARLYGPLRANALRLLLACAVLGLLTFLVDRVRGKASFHPDVFPALFLSGLVGFGLGDIGLYLAYPRLGARLTVLLNFSLATLFAAWGDWVFLGESLTAGQGGSIGLILAGLILALWPAAAVGPRRIVPWAGLAWAVLAGAGQGLGTTLSGWANQLAEASHITIHGLSQAFQRSTAGVLAALPAWWIWQRWFQLAPAAVPPGKVPGGQHPRCWLAGAALFGPVAGVSCFQWARLELPSALVVAVAATSALWVIPLAFFIEKDHPAARQITGTLLAVAGIVLLYLKP